MQVISTGITQKYQLIIGISPPLPAVKKCNTKMFCDISTDKPGKTIRLGGGKNVAFKFSAVTLLPTHLKQKATQQNKL